MRKETTEKFQFEAGEYYVGDLCYIFSSENWDEIIEQTCCFGLDDTKADADLYKGDFVYKGYRGWEHSTFWGDGEYLDNSDNMYWVDSGMLGIYPIEGCDEMANGGDFVKFDKPFEVWYDDGTFYFGNVIIKTKGE